MNQEIRVEDVSFRYHRDNVIERAHFHITRGSFVSFIGPNGGGKSTMAKLILGLLTPDSGEISIFGKSPKEMSHLLGYVPQHSHFDSQFPINVSDVILMGILNKSKFFYSAKDRKAAAQALDSVGLAGSGKRHFSELSGGQQQRVLIARALLSDPEILLLDEPTASIDAESQKRLYNLLLKLNQKRTIILISHDLDFVAENVDKVICIDKKVAIHPTGKLEPESCRIFGHELRVVQHEHILEESHD